MPFWKGDQPGRPVELGRAIGARLRTLTRRRDEAAARQPARRRARRVGRRQPAGLPARAAGGDPAAARRPHGRGRAVPRRAGRLADGRPLCARRPGQRAVGAGDRAPARRAVRRRRQVMPSDDGIVVRLPDTADEPPGADLVAFDPDEIAQIVEESVGTSALFAARFRECAARSLLLPRRDPRRRQPLWQQRQRAAQLLDVAREYADFPVTLEAARECLQDVFDVPGLVGADARPRRPQGAAGRGGDAAAVAVRPVAAVRLRRRVPLRGRRAAGRAPGRRAGAGLDAARRAARPGRPARAARPGGGRRDRAAAAVADRRAARRATPRTSPSCCACSATCPTPSWPRAGAEPAWAAELEPPGAAIRVRIAGEERWIGVEDAGRFRDALGRRAAGGHRARRYLEPVADPLGDLVARYARTHGPFAGRGLRGPVRARRVRGRAGAQAARPRPAGWCPASSRPAARGTEWCDAEVLRMLRRRSLAALRKEIEPVPPRALAAFLPRWQQVGSSGARRRGGRRGRSSSCRASPCRPRRWSGWCCPPGWPTTPRRTSTSCAPAARWSGPAPGRSRRRRRLGHARLRRLRAAAAARRRTGGAGATPLHEAVLDALDGGQALFFRALSDRVGRGRRRRRCSPRCGTWSGPACHNDTLAPLRGAARRQPGRTGRARRGPHPLPPARPAGPAHAGARAPARRPLPAAGPGCPSATRPDPAGRRAGRRCCSNATAWSPAAR